MVFFNPHDHVNYLGNLYVLSSADFSFKSNFSTKNQEHYKSVKQFVFNQGRHSVSPDMG